VLGPAAGRTRCLAGRSAAQRRQEHAKRLATRRTTTHEPGRSPGLALEWVMNNRHRLPDRLGQQTSRTRSAPISVGADLAVGPGGLPHDRRHPGRAGQHPHPARARARPASPAPPAAGRCRSDRRASAPRCHRRPERPLPRARSPSNPRTASDRRRTQRPVVRHPRQVPGRTGSGAAEPGPHLQPAGPRVERGDPDQPALSSAAPGAMAGRVGEQLVDLLDRGCAEAGQPQGEPFIASFPGRPPSAAG
jgi:hypothetical protein